jgi:hypothetical protein
MTSNTKLASVAAYLVVACGAPAAVQAAIPYQYSLKPGTVLSTHTPDTGGCQFMKWQLTIGPNDTVAAKIEQTGVSKNWELTGTYDSHGTYHLNGHELDGAKGATIIDAQVQADGSMIFTMADAGDPSPCFNRTLYLPWFRNGNDFNPSLTGSGSGG